MNTIYQPITTSLITTLALLCSATVLGFDSGSSGSDGVMNITEDTELRLPPSGILNYSSISIAEGATLTFSKNSNNTPVTLLSSGDVLIDGTIDVSGQPGGANTQIPHGGRGGSGGFDGGLGGQRGNAGNSRGQDGQGPGRGIGSSNGPGASASFGTGTNSYGNVELLPLIGGSGGGGGSGFRGIRGSGGGGGGGAILISASGTVTVNGSILANGGLPGARRGGFDGGFGSGGAIRIVTTTLTGEGSISASAPGGSSFIGRIRLEVEDFNRVAETTPAYNFGSPNLLFVPNLPTLRISSVGGINAPATLDGLRDVILPGITTNPVAVAFTTTHVPDGNTITLTATPERDASVVVQSQPVTSNSTTASIDLPNGNSLLSAQLLIELTASLGSDYSRYAQGQPVKQIKLDIDALGQSTTTFITDSGAEYTLPANALTLR